MGDNNNNNNAATTNNNNNDATNNNNNNNNNKCSCKSSFQFNEETKKTTCEIVKNDPSYQYSNICGFTIRNKKNIYDFLNIRVSDIVQKKDYDYDDTTNNNNNIDNNNNNNNNNKIKEQKNLEMP